MKISASEQVQLWLRGLPPGTRRRVRQALLGLATDRAHTLDLKPLRRELEGFYRLRVGDYRIVYHLETRQVIRLDSADIRDVVYDVFRQLRALRESGE
jgi:mRNA-degrading endonuclease RelE of RelBE toxin-antitoxin system